MPSRPPPKAQLSLVLDPRPPSPPMVVPTEAGTPLADLLLAAAGQLGVQFGACANAYSAADGKVVSVDHGCGGHSSVMPEPAPPVTVSPGDSR